MLILTTETIFVCNSPIYLLSEQGSKADTIGANLSAVNQAHTMRGMEAPVLSDTAVSAAIKGRTNKECLKGHSDRAVMTLQIMKDLDLGSIGVALHGESEGK